jgi:hypothetical protein
MTNKLQLQNFKRSSQELPAANRGLAMKLASERNYAKGSDYLQYRTENTLV